VVIYPFAQLLSLGLDLLEPMHIFLEGAECLIIDIFVLYGREQITIERGDHVLSGSGVRSNPPIEICRVFHRLIDVCVRDYVFA